MRFFMHKGAVAESGLIHQGYPVAPCVPPETEADPVQRLFCQLNLALDELLVMFRYFNFVRCPCNSLLWQNHLNLCIYNNNNNNNNVWLVNDHFNVMHNRDMRARLRQLNVQLHWSSTHKWICEMPKCPLDKHCPLENLFQGSKKSSNFRTFSGQFTAFGSSKYYQTTLKFAV